MPLPLLLLIPVAAGAGALASKLVAWVRTEVNEGETIQVQCKVCLDSGPHLFVTIDRSWVAGAAVGVVVGGIGGAVAGVVADRIFRCRLCGKAMLENGERPSWNADEAIDAMINYPALKDAFEQLQAMIARNQEIARRHAGEIAEIRAALADAMSDKVSLEAAIRSLIGQMQAEAA